MASEKKLPKPGDIWRLFDDKMMSYIDIEIMEFTHRNGYPSISDVIYDILPIVTEPPYPDHCAMSLERWLKKKRTLLTSAKERRGVILSRNLGVI